MDEAFIQFLIGKGIEETEYKSYDGPTKLKFLDSFEQSKKSNEPTFSSNGLPPLAARSGSTSEPSENKKHPPAIAEFGTFKAYENIKVSGGRILWTKYAQQGPLPWATESDIQALVKDMLVDAISGVGLSDKIQCFNELSVFDLRPDIWLVLAGGFPIGVVEVKTHSNDILKSPRVCGQIFDYMLRLKSFFGLTHVFGLVTTYERSRIFWFDESDAVANASVSPTDIKEETTADVDESEVFSSEPATEDICASKSSDVLRKLKAGSEIVWNDPAFSKLLATLIQKMYEARLTRGFVRLIDSSRPYILINEEGWSWAKISFPESFRLHHDKLPSATSLLLLRDLGHGADGRVWQASSMNGLGCAIKFALNTEGTIESEFENWKQKAPTQAKKVILGGKPALMMPFVHYKPRSEWTTAHLEAVQKEIESFVKKGFLHADLKPVHVGFTSPKKDGKPTAMFIDLARMQKITGKQKAEATQRMREALQMTD